MRKSVLALSVALLGCVVAAPVAYAAPSTFDTKKACADVVDGRATYQSVPDPTTPEYAEVLAQMDLRGTACKNITYTMTVLVSDTDSTPIATVDGISEPGAADGSTPPRVQFRTDHTTFPNPAPTEVCVVITTSKSNGTVLDSAPDTGCVPLLLDSDVSGSQKFR